MEKEAVFGSIEAVKTVSDLFMPLSGEIISLNEDLENNPELVNTDPYGKGWMIKIKYTDLDEISELLDNKSYEGLVH
jgi:glycine cleavage system H protein